MNKPAQDGSGKANIQRESGQEVQGLLIEREEDTLALLDQFEKGYQRTKVKTEGGWAWTYIYPQASGNIPATEEYANIILSAMQKLDFDPAYIKATRAIAQQSKHIFQD